MYNILLVEDKKAMQQIIVDYFKTKDCQVYCTSDGVEAIDSLEEREYDLVLLDIMMPKLDGLSVCKKIRQDMDVPIIFVTAKTGEEDILQGYNLGADDYITKPFSLHILYAKSIALMKRAKGKVLGEMIKVNGICVDCRNYIVTVGGKEVKLAPMEYRLLIYLMHNKNQTLTREQILIKLWGYDYEGSDRILDTHMKKLRHALGKSGKCIRTVIKVGYRMEAKE